MTRRTTALLVSTVLFALACGSGDAPKPASTEEIALTSDNPQCCVDRSVDPSRYRTDVDRAGCEALGNHSLWMASKDCAPVCCVIAGTASRLPGGECGQKGAPVDDAVCAGGGEVPSVCCVDQGRYLPADAPECGPSPGLSYQEATDRRGRGKLVAAAECEPVCCEYADFKVRTELKAQCGGRAIDRDPCVAEKPANAACCRASCDTTGATMIRTYWEGDGDCTEAESLCDHSALDVSECAALAFGEVKEDWVSDPDFKDGEYVGPGSDAAPAEVPAADAAPAPTGTPRVRPPSERPRPASEGKPRPR